MPRLYVFDMPLSFLCFRTEGEQMKRKFRLANAKQILMFNSDAKRAAQHQAQASSIQRKQKRYNNEVAMAQCEVIQQQQKHTRNAYASHVHPFRACRGN